MIHEKIKQRLLGLLGVCIILMAFVPVLFEEPPTFLAIAPTLVPQAPDMPEPGMLFESSMPEGGALKARIEAERAAYAEALSINSADEPPSSEPFLPTDSSVSVSLPQTQGPLGETVIKEVVLPKAWVIALDKVLDYETARDIQATLLTHGLRSFLKQQPYDNAGNDIKLEEQAVLAQDLSMIYVGPFLRHEDAQESTNLLSDLFPDQTLKLLPFMPVDP